MVLGLAKSFVIALLIAIAVGYGMKDWTVSFYIIGVFALARIGWKILTK